MSFPIARPIFLPDSPGLLARLIETEIISGMEQCLSANEIATRVADILASPGPVAQIG